jgi:predicted enzyme related to lactoylglutathione lyase
MENPSTLLVVYDLQISKEFYINLLGLELIEEQKDCLKLRAGSHHIFMFQGDNKAVPYEHGYSANSTLVFTVENLDEKTQQLKSHGVPFVHEQPNQNKWGRYAGFKDPSGIVHELMEFCM